MHLVYYNCQIINVSNAEVDPNLGPYQRSRTGVFARIVNSEAHKLFSRKKSIRKGRKYAFGIE